MIKVSIITVVFNGVSFIEQAINSVLKQTYPYIEYIIVDNQSSDGTLEIVNKYKDKLTLISEPDLGMYDAMNKGIAKASGELIGILNSDDWYQPNAVEVMVAAYQQNPHYSIFHGLLRYVGSDGKVFKVAGHPYTFLKRGMIEHPTCFVHHKVYDKLKFNLSYAIVSDYDFMLNAQKLGFEFYFVEQLIANFRSGGVSGSFTSAKEALTLQYRYKLISNVKRYILTIYFWIRLKL